MTLSLTQAIEFGLNNGSKGHTQFAIYGSDNICNFYLRDAQLFVLLSWEISLWNAFIEVVSNSARNVNIGITFLVTLRISQNYETLISFCNQKTSSLQLLGNYSALFK